MSLEIDRIIPNDDNGIHKEDVLIKNKRFYISCYFKSLILSLLSFIPYANGFSSGDFSKLLLEMFKIYFGEIGGIKF
jgi:hypothetical protein